MINKTVNTAAIYTDVATRFVDLVLKRTPKEWSEINTLSEDEARVLFNTLSVAGFNLKKLEVGKLVGDYIGQSGSTTGETYPINRLCPFKVIYNDGKDHRFSTGWLDCAFMRVAQSNESRKELIKVITEEIERSIPLKPIQITPEGDFLREFCLTPLNFGPEYFIQHKRDENVLNSNVGIHKFCNGDIYRVRATETHDAILCQKCYLRVLFSKEVKTYGELREEFAFKCAKVSA